MAENPPRKFLFDRSFDDGSKHAHAAQRKPVTLNPEQVDALKKEAYDSGFSAGQKVVSETQAVEMARILGRIEQLMQHLADTSEADHQQRQSMVGEIVLAIARKLLPDFMARNGLQEIQALLGEVIAEMVHEPRLVVRIHESQFDSINTRIKDIAAKNAYAGKVVVLADADVIAGDCRIEWADGGVERDTQATWENVEQTLTPQPIQQTLPNEEKAYG